MSYLTAICSRNLNFTSQSEKSEIILLRQSRCFHTLCNCKFQCWLKTPHKIDFSHKLSLVGCLNSGCEHRGKEKVGKSNSGRSQAWPVPSPCLVKFLQVGVIVNSGILYSYRALYISAVMAIKTPLDNSKGLRPWIARV